MKALITGASSGIGRDMARILSREQNAELILVARRVDRLYELSEELPTKVQVISCDLSKQKECFTLFQQVKEENVNVLINNAGFGLVKRFADSSLERELEMISTNIKAVHILTKLFLREFQKKNHGYLLNVASSAAFLPGPEMATYYATKSYVLRLTQAIAAELSSQKSKVKISVLCPGPVRTEFDRVSDGKFTIPYLSSEYVARVALEGLFQGKTTIIPGKLMKLFRFGEHLLPDRILAQMAQKMQKRN